MNQPIRVWDQLQMREGLLTPTEPGESFVMATTGPGGGSAFLTTGAYPLWLQGASLLDRVPLPSMRPIMTPRNINIAGILSPVGSTVSIEATPDEMYGESIRIDLPAGLTSATGRITIPIRERVGGGFPRALQRSEVRLRVSDWRVTPAVTLYLSENVEDVPRGHLWELRASTMSRFGIISPHVESAWNNKFRTLQLSKFQGQGVSPVDVPPWEDGAEFETRSIQLRLSTTSAVTVWINRVVSPEWPCAGVIMQGDGGHQSFYEHLAVPYMRRGWPGVVSRGGAGEDSASPRITSSQWDEMKRFGWIHIRHHSHWLPTATDTEIPATDSFDSVATTPEQLAEFTQRWTEFWGNSGFSNPGFAYGSSLRNQHPTSMADAASVLRANGCVGGRGRMSDAEFGIHPGDAKTNVTGLATPMAPFVPGWSPRWGRFNRMYIDAASSVANTPTARDTYVGGHLERAINRAVAGNELTWWYTHRIQPLTETTPAEDQNGPRFAADYLAHMDELVRADKVVPLTPLQADLLTYDRPGDVYMDWSGAWRSRTTGKVVL